MSDSLTSQAISVAPTTTVEVAESDFDISATREIRSQNTYIIRPKFSHKFRPAAVKEMIHVVLAEKLHGKSYSHEDTTAWTKDIADSVKLRLKEMGNERYKFVVQVVIGEQKGEGVKMGCRCFWDSDTDNYAQDIFISDSLFCVAAAYGVFKY